MAGQAISSKRAAAKKAPTAAELSADVQNDEKLLQSPDVANSPKLSDAIKADWIKKICQIEVLSLPTSMMQNPEFVDEVSSACLKRLNGQEQVGDIASASSGGMPVAKPPGGPPCSVVSSLPTASGDNTKYGYEIRCAKGVTPDAIAISTAQAQPAVTEAQGKAFAQGFAAALGIPPPSYDSANSTVSFTLPAGAGSHSFEFLMPTASTQVTTATYFIASGGAGVTKCLSSSPSGQCSIDAILIPVPKATTCPNESVVLNVSTPKLNAVDVGSDSASGTLPKGTKGTAQLCSGAGVPLGKPVTVDTTTGDFSVTGLTKLPAAQTLKAGDNIAAQFTNAANISGPPSANLTVGNCKADQPADQTKGASSKLPAPTKLDISVDANNMATYSGTVPNGTKGVVRICVGDVPIPNSDAKTARISSDGNFSGGTNSFSVKAGDTIYAQICTPGSTSDTWFGTIRASEFTHAGNGRAAGGRLKSLNEPSGRSFHCWRRAVRLQFSW